MKLPVENTVTDAEHTSSRPQSRAGTEERVPRIHERVVDYSEYMWMGEEMEEFDRQCMEQILEDEFIEDCFEEMLEEEDEVYDLVQWFCEEYEDVDPKVVIECLQSLALDNNIELTFLQDPTACRRQAQQHKLNPNAPEFVPSSSSSVSNTHQESPPLSDEPHDR